MTRLRMGADGWLIGGERVPSPNFNQRPENDGRETCLIVVHSISLPPGCFRGPDVLKLFTNRLDCSRGIYVPLQGLKVASHFFLRRHGRLVQCVSCADRAWHAGRSSWHGREECNDYSIGIELEGSEQRPFDRRQYPVLAHLIAALVRRYPIQAVVGHEHIAAGRKQDPGPYFNWQRLQRYLPSLPLSWPEGVSSAKSGLPPNLRNARRMTML